MNKQMLPSSLSPHPMQSPVVQKPQPQPHRNQSLDCDFHIYPLIEKLSKEIETGTSDYLVTELKNRFENCQNMLTSISGSLGCKTMTVDGEKQKLEESEKLLEQRRLFYNVEIVSHPNSKKPEEEMN